MYFLWKLTCAIAVFPVSLKYASVPELRVPLNTATVLSDDQVARKLYISTRAHAPRRRYFLVSTALDLIQRMSYIKLFPIFVRTLLLMHALK